MRKWRVLAKQVTYGQGFTFCAWKMHLLAPPAGRQSKYHAPSQVLAAH